MVKEVEFTTDKYCFAAWLVRAVVIRYPSTAPTLRSACTWIGSSFVGKKNFDSPDNQAVNSMGTNWPNFASHDSAAVVDKRLRFSTMPHKLQKDPWPW